MKSEMKRWKKKIFSLNMHEAKSGVVSNLRDAEMKSKMKRWKKISVQTHVKPNLVLFQIQEMKSEMKRWKKFSGPNIHQAKYGVISNLRDEEWDAEMKNKSWSKHMSSQIWCYLKFER